MRLALVALSVAGCAGQFGNSLESDDLPDAAEEPERPIGRVHGVEREQVEYEMKLRGLTVGRMQIAVGDRGVVDGRQAVVVHSRASGAGLADAFGEFRWELTTTIDIDAGCALEEDEEVDISFVSKQHHEHNVHKFALADCHHNFHTAGGALRGWRSHIGSHGALDLDIGGGRLDIDLSDGGRESISTVLGNTPAIRYEGVFRNRFFITGWLSDDDARVPLRMHSDSKLGSIDIELVSYEVPSDH
jgi:hypothetical protein